MSQVCMHCGTLLIPDGKGWFCDEKFSYRCWDYNGEHYPERA